MVYIDKSVCLRSLLKNEIRKRFLKIPACRMQRNLYHKNRYFLDPGNV